MATNVKSLIGQTFPPVPIAYTTRDAILYAIGVGAKDLAFIYEKDPSFACLPTYSTCLKLKGDSSDVVPFTVKSAFGDFPGLNINPAMILHGEQHTEILAPLPPAGKFIGQGRVAHIYDKGKGALLEMEFTISDAAGKVYTKDVFGMFIRGAGGFGGDKGPANQNENAPPQRAPDAVVEETTAPNQAQIFRLSGDYNPLHVDPSLAQMVGFSNPILHGLSTYGFAARAVLKSFAENDPARLKSFRVRFATPVMPGDTLVTQMWKEGGKIIFQTLVKSSGKVALSNCAAELRAAPAAATTAAPASAAAPAVTLKSAPVFEAMAKAIATNKALVDKIKAVYQFNIKAGGQTVTYTVDAKNKDSAGVKAGQQGQADCTITMDDADFVDLAAGKLDAMAAFGQGKIKLGGNMMLAQKLSVLTQAAAKL